MLNSANPNNITQQSLFRLLNLIDKNPASATYGCLDRNFWHLRYKDFPSATAQMSALSLLLFSTRTANPQEKIAYIELSKAAIQYLVKIQNSDGSWDEWYPNERGWAGPTGYLALALYLIYEQKILPAETQELVHETFLKAVTFLCHRDEGDFLGNHYALSLTVLSLAHQLTQKKNFSEAFNKYWHEFLNKTSEEGWTYEYDGLDIGYQYGTLNFFADLYRVTKNSSILEYAKKSFRFLHQIMTPDGKIPSNLGSRQTTHMYFWGLHFWSQHIQEAKEIFDVVLPSYHQALAPHDQEDHYLHYRLADYLRFEGEFTSFAQSQKSLLMPYQKSQNPTITHHKDAGIIQIQSGHFFLLINSKKGGSFRVYRGQELIGINNGYILKESQTTLLSSSFVLENEILLQQDSVVIKGHCLNVFNKQFTPLKFTLFRFANLLCSNAKIAYAFKLIIRHLMITPPKKQKSSYTRRIEWNEQGITVHDTISCDQTSHLFWGGDFHVRYVPQGHYSSPQEIRFRPHFFDVRGKSKFSIKQTYTLQTEEAPICVG